MNILAWENFSKRRNSTKQPNTVGTTISVTLKDATSIENPTFILTNDGHIYNYLYAFNHYYFVDNLAFVTNDIIEISCSQDTLATNKSVIGNYTGYIQRAATGYDVDVRDNLISAKQSISRATSASTAITGYDSVNGSYVLRVQGPDGIKKYAGSYTQLRAALAYAFDADHYIDFDFDDIDITNVTGGIDVIRKILFQWSIDPSRYIIDCKWFPFDLAGASADDFYMGFYNLGTSSGMSICPRFAVTEAGAVTLPARYYGDFRDYDPSWSRYSIYIPGIGETNLDASSLSNGLNYDLNVDVATGSATCILTDDSGAHISTLAGNMGVDMQIGFASPQSAMMQSLANSFSSGTRDNVPITGPTLSAPTGDFKAGRPKGNPNKYAAAEYILGEGGEKAKQIGSNLLSAGLSIASTLPMFNSNTNVIGIPGNVGTLKVFHDIVVSVQNYGSKDIPVSVAGRPVYKIDKVSNYSGYIELSGASIDMAGLSDERDAVNSFLNNGFYYE